MAVQLSRADLYDEAVLEGDAPLESALSRLVDASQLITESLEPAAVEKAVVEAARHLTQARYGALVLYDPLGKAQNFVSSGLSTEQMRQMVDVPQGRGLLDYMNQMDGPLRVQDIANHDQSVGFPHGHPPMETFLGMPIVLADGSRIGNIYLAEKAGHLGFTELDETMITRFAALAGQALENSRRYDRERRIKTDLRALVKIAPVGLVVFDAKSGIILTSNQECQRIAGQDGTAAMSWEAVFDSITMRRSDGQIILAGDRPTMQVLQSGEVVRGEEIVLCFPDGREIHTLVNGAPIYSEDEEIVSVVVSVQDLTPLQDAARMRAEFLGMVSHELRTPLTAIKGSIVALMDIISSLNAAEAAQLVQIIDQQGEVMRNQINRLIELSNIDAGTLQLSLEQAAVSDLIGEAIQDFSRSHPGMSIAQEVPDDLPGVMIDHARIAQMLRDIFAHLFKYASEASTMSIKARHEDFHVALSISKASDRGHQADLPELAQRIGTDTQKFGQAEASGDALILTICKGIAEAHGGGFRYERPDHGHGMTFTFTLPVANDIPDDASGIRSMWSQSADQPAAGMPQILIAGDDPHTMQSMRQTLHDANYDPVVAHTFGELARLIAQSNETVLVVDMSTAGPTAFEALRRAAAGRQVQIIAVVDEGDGDRALRATEMGADWCLVKPVSPDELLGRIRTPLRKTSKAASAQRNDGYWFGTVSIDYASHRVTVENRPVALTATEYKLLHELSSHPGRVLTQDQLLHRVWGPEYGGESQLLRAYVKSLRQKLGDDARNPSYIFTEHGVGYRMAKP